LEESPCTLLLKFHERRHFSHPSGVNAKQNELPEQEQLKLREFLLLDQLSFHSPSRKFEYITLQPIWLYISLLSHLHPTVTLLSPM